MLWLLILVVVGLVLFGESRPVWLPKLPDNRVTGAIQRNAAARRRAVQKRWGRLQVFSFWRPRLGKPLKRWTGEVELVKKAALYKSLPDEAAGFTAWFERLSEVQADEFARQLAAFCRSLNLDLARLFDPNVDQETRAALEDVVMLYSLAAWRERSLRPVTLFQAWQAAPRKKENRAFAEELYLRLIEAGLATTPPELVLAPEKQRYAHVTRAIQTAAAQDRPAVLGLVAELYGEGEMLRLEQARRGHNSQRRTADARPDPAAAAVEVVA